MRPLAKVSELELADRAVFLRLDLNVPMADGKITSDARIRAALPTIEYLLAQGAQVALASHFGRPKGKRDPKYSLEPVGVRLSEILARDVVLADDCVGDGVKRLVRELRPGGLVLLENLRFHAGEEKNDSQFAKALAAPFAVYVNDAFGASHRAHASIVGMVESFHERGAGLLLVREVEALSQLIDKPARPFVAVVGGAKVSDKVGALGALLSHVDHILVGGAMAYTLLKAGGQSVGKSHIEADKLYVARELLARAEVRGIKIVLPEDHVVAERFAADATPKISPIVPENCMGLDIGPRTRERFADLIRGAATVFFNGPMGVFEWPSYAAGTLAVAEAVAACAGYTVVGGGDSVAAVEQAGVADRVKHVSTGGGAALEFLELGTLPGLDVLRVRKT